MIFSKKVINLVDKLKFAPWRFSRFRSPSNPGDRMKKIYAAKFDDNGVLELNEVGQEDLYDYIQSFAESCDINVLLNRFQCGDTEVLNKVQGFYFDVTDVPDNMADLLNKLNHAESEFNKLPSSFKERYGNDFARFICSFDPRDLISDLVKPDDPVLIKEEGEADES